MKDATCDIDTIRAWWKHVPPANIAIATGGGLFVIDLDSDEALAEFERLIEPQAPFPRPKLSTARGRHLYFKTSGPVQSGNGRLGKGVDVKGDGGYVLVPPSVHPSGSVYLTLKRGEIAPAPQWLLDLITKKPSPRLAWTAGIIAAMWQTAHALIALDNECRRVSNAPKGFRNDTLNKAAFAIGTLVGGRLLSKGMAEAALFDAAKKCGLDVSESLATIKSGLSAGMLEPGEWPLGGAETDAREHPGGNGKSNRSKFSNRGKEEQAHTHILTMARCRCFRRCLQPSLIPSMRSGRSRPRQKL